MTPTLVLVASGVIAGGCFLFLRPWQLNWGATREEIARSMPGDEVVTRPTFNATRAVTVDALPEAIWPWLVQIGFGRAGWYSYDLLDNFGHHSAETIVPELQHIHVGDPIPMGPGGSTGVWVKALEVDHSILWWNKKSKRSTWVWTLTPTDDGRTRLVTRVRSRPTWGYPSTMMWIPLVEVADFPMMRKCLLGIKQRAEHFEPTTPGLGKEETTQTVPRAPLTTGKARAGAHRAEKDESPSPRQLDPSILLYWLPLGAGARFVRFNGRIYETLKARRERRPPLDLYHSALVVTVPEGHFVIENAWPIPAGKGTTRGVAVEGPVGSRHFGRFRALRYEIRCWHDGVIADIDQAVDSPRGLSHDEDQAHHLLQLVSSVPQLMWGRDELHVGEMWNSNSVISWLLARSGLKPEEIRPPAGGRAPGWAAGVRIATSDPKQPSQPSVPLHESAPI
ncbi:MAG: hypothetical protein QOG21_2262 [Actinomycetota bacterium]|nr:hypothetical protein [Actinomycetota bacterium]